MEGEGERKPDKRRYREKIDREKEGENKERQVNNNEKKRCEDKCKLQYNKLK